MNGMDGRGLAVFDNCTGLSSQQEVQSDIGQYYLVSYPPDVLGGCVKCSTLINSLVGGCLLLEARSLAGSDFSVLEAFPFVTNSDVSKSVRTAERIIYADLSINIIECGVRNVLHPIQQEIGNNSSFIWFVVALNYLISWIDSDHGLVLLFMGNPLSGVQM